MSMCSVESMSAVNSVSSVNSMSSVMSSIPVTIMSIPVLDCVWVSYSVGGGVAVLVELWGDVVAVPARGSPHGRGTRCQHQTHRCSCSNNLHEDIHSHSVHSQILLPQCRPTMQRGW